MTQSANSTDNKPDDPNARCEEALKILGAGEDSETGSLEFAAALTAAIEALARRSDEYDTSRDIRVLAGALETNLRDGIDRLQRIEDVLAAPQR